MLTIGKLSDQSGLSRDCLRYYEREGLLAPAGKTNAGYRLYDSTSVQRVAFIKHAKRCGFSLSEINELLGLKADNSSCCIDIRNVAVDKKKTIDTKISDLGAMSEILGRLIDMCSEDNKTLEHCPIISALTE